MKHSLKNQQKNYFSFLNKKEDIKNSSYNVSLVLYASEFDQIDEPTFNLINKIKDESSTLTFLDKDSLIGSISSAAKSKGLSFPSEEEKSQFWKLYETLKFNKSNNDFLLNHAERNLLVKHIVGGKKNLNPVIETTTKDQYSNMSFAQLTETVISQEFIKAHKVSSILNETELTQTVNLILDGLVKRLYCSREEAFVGFCILLQLGIFLHTKKNTFYLLNGKLFTRQLVLEVYIEKKCLHALRDIAVFLQKSIAKIAQAYDIASYAFNDFRSRYSEIFNSLSENEQTLAKYYYASFQDSNPECPEVLRKRFRKQVYS
jgi:hypothetical protein